MKVREQSDCALVPVNELNNGGQQRSYTRKNSACAEKTTQEDRHKDTKGTARTLPGKNL